MIPTEGIPFTLPDCVIDTFEILGNTLIVQAHSLQTKAPCPDCNVTSDSVHSVYRRHPQDVPCWAYTVQMTLQVHRFRCRNQACPRRTFAENLPELVPRYARRTTRLTQVMVHVGLEVGAETGGRVLAYLQVHTSGDTLLRIIRQQALPEVETPRVLGIDDWAFKRGKSYGTILVDLERHQPIDLLPDRDAETIMAWLAEHPGIEIICRDRSSEYTKAISEAAPDAIQVADRWHLLKNLGDAVQKCLKLYSAELRTVARILNEVVSGDCISMPDLLPDYMPMAPETDPRWPVFHEVKALHAQGLSQWEISRRLQINRRTIAKYILADTLPIRKASGGSNSTVTPYMPYLRQRWAEGCHNLSQLWHEITDQGFTGTRACVSRALKPLYGVHPNLRPSEAVLPAFQALSPRQAMWVLTLPTQQLKADEIRYRDLLLEHVPDLPKLYALVQGFSVLLKAQAAEALDTWLGEAQASGLHALKQFARGLIQDYAAVKAAFALGWSSGQVEGQVNRLKFIKRQMYGRAKFDLLKQRILYQIV